MIIVDDILVSDDVIERKFVCNLIACKGACCVAGDAGAPLDEEETEILDQQYANIKPYLTKEGITAIEEQGNWIIDSDGDFSTPLVKGGACAYVVFDEQGITKCGIEIAYKAGATHFRKPISCHLYPIRIKKGNQFEALNYHSWDICAPACQNGKDLGVRVYEFLKEPLIRKYGQDWYDALVGAVQFSENSNTPKSNE